MDIVMLLQILFFVYIIFLYSGYLFLNVVSFLGIWGYIHEKFTNTLPRISTGLEQPISILLPAYNEEDTIKGAILSLLQLDYSEYEVLVINDGSNDNTLNILIEQFALVPFPEAYRIRIQTKSVNRVYRSTKYRNLRVIDKVNGGKADALNAGINAARYPLFCSIDADSYLQRDSLQRVVRPFLNDPDTVAAGGTIRIVNGCKIKDGVLVEIGLPKSLLGKFQMIEYLRAFHFGRLGWSILNSLMVISGTFSLFHKETVIEIGGYLPEIVGEDMELIVRMHRHLGSRQKKYRIVFIPDPICWTEVPEKSRDLGFQRARWHQGLSESLTKNSSLLFNPKAGFLGMVAFPFVVFFEWLGPIIEFSGYVFFITGIMLNLVSYQALGAFLLLSVGFNLIISVTSLMLEQISFPVYTKPRYFVIIVLGSVIEIFGYRQLICFYRLVGLWRWLTGNRQWVKASRTYHLK